MAWQAFFQSADEREQGFFITLICSDGQQKQSKTGTITTLDDASVKALARAEVAKLEDATAGKSRLTIHAGDLIDLTQPTPPADPDPAKTKFLADFRKLQSLQRAVDLGALAAGAKTYTDLKALVMSEWDDRYAGLI